MDYKMYHTEDFGSSAFKPARFEADNEIILDGKTIPYHTVSEDNVFYDTAGNPIASIFSYSYFRSDIKDPTDRPVLFIFNGGPGSSSMYVHAGFIGPKRIIYGEEADRPTALPPYEVIDNQETLLGESDLVFVDPVGTGYGVLINEEESSRFYGIQEDAEAFLIFVQKWLHRYNRWRSPKYLVGESYGCTRIATVVGIAAAGSDSRAYNIAFDGVVMIGNTVTMGTYYGNPVPTEPSVMKFSTYAAVNWFHNHPTKQTLEEFVAEAREFAENNYLVALYKGDALQGDERKNVVKKICYYAGVDEDYIENRGLKFDDNSFRSEVIKAKNKAVARYDGRITREFFMPLNTEIEIGGKADALTDRYSAYFLGALCGYILPMLGVELERVYIPSMPMRSHKRWNEEAPLGITAEQLRCAMVRTPGMRVMFANGYYDLCTFTGIVYYTVNHAGLPKDRVEIREYPSGHMIYIGDENIKSLCGDIKAFVKR